MTITIKEAERLLKQHTGQTYKISTVGMVILLIGLEMVRYQSYQEEEAAQIRRRRKQLFRHWVEHTDLRKG